MSMSGTSTSSRGAACKYLRRRCPSDCIFSPYFPPNNPQRFACVHRIYGASNVGKMLEQLRVELRAEAAQSLYQEAKCRIGDPVYGSVGIITYLHREIHNAQCQLARAQAQLALFTSKSVSVPPDPYANIAPDHSYVPVVAPHHTELGAPTFQDSTFYGHPSTYWF